MTHALQHPSYKNHKDICQTCAWFMQPPNPYERDRLLDHLTSMMNGGPGAKDDQRRGYWAKVAFENFIVRELRGAGDRPSPDDWLTAKKSAP